MLRNAAAAFKSVAMSRCRLLLSSSLSSKAKYLWFSTTKITSTTTTTRPFRILGLQQVAIGSTNRSALHELWVNVLGIAPTHSNIRIDSENVVEDILRVGIEPFAVEIDLMTPIDEEKSPKVRSSYLCVGCSCSSRCVRCYGLSTHICLLFVLDQVHVPPLNHIGLWVDDLAMAVDYMTNAGVRFTPGGIRVGAAGHAVAFIHPKANDSSPIAGNGVLIELVQAPPDVIQAHDNNVDDGRK
jgi:lactoylglutathione lyase